MGFLRRVGLTNVPKAIVLDARTLETVAELDVGGRRGAVDASPDAVWFTTHSAATLSQVDPAAARVVAETPLPERPVDLAVVPEGVVVLSDRGRVMRVAAGVLVAANDVGGDAMAIAADGDRVWLLAAGGAASDGRLGVRMTRLDPATLVPRVEVAVGRSRFVGALRVSGDTACVLMEIAERQMGEAVLDAVTGERVAPERAGRAPLGLAEADGERWILDGPMVRRVDATTRTEIASGRLAAPDTAGAVLAHGRLWICTYRRGKRGEAATRH
jgi:streptogramin lyase